MCPDAGASVTSQSARLDATANLSCARACPVRRTCSIGNPIDRYPNFRVSLWAPTASGFCRMGDPTSWALS